MPSLVDSGSAVFKRKMKLGKFTTTTVAKTDSGHILIGNSNLSLWLRRAKNWDTLSIICFNLRPLINLNFYIRSS